MKTATVEAKVYSFNHLAPDIKAKILDNDGICTFDEDIQDAVEKFLSPRIGFDTFHRHSSPDEFRKNSGSLLIRFYNDNLNLAPFMKKMPILEEVVNVWGIELLMQADITDTGIRSLRIETGSGDTNKRTKELEKLVRSYIEEKVVPYLKLYAGWIKEQVDHRKESFKGKYYLANGDEVKCVK